ncbi:FAD/FMN-containing dehydrogenase [Homoserinimonas aerilata]|uniref:FAD/FMN-containing dehydrogenase n=1 Tax=Homoserinimonas aerilata TaxID=1162970 RepID=A0A542YK18_9MICO|nr:FAD-binding protein [Homoserinimonas aerilata]TQL48410.1 FAD/FMN-containing dehydrogenase [Homoserinimonas aerilata]
MIIDTDLEFTGRIVTPDAPDWDDARVGRMFNGRRPGRQPAAVLVAENEQDIVNGVRLARANGWSVVTRSGGHSWAGWTVQDGTLLIDIGNLQDIRYDDETKIVSAQPAVKGGDVLSPFLEERGRFFNGGHCPSVGIGGFLLQGGQGWNQRGWGWAAESVVAIDVVTAEGILVRADEKENSDLFWAARGAGPAFPGVVTRFHLATREKFGFLGHTVQAFELDDFSPVMTWLYETHKSVSTDVEIVAVSTPTPLPDGTERRVLLVTAVALVADRAAAEEALAPFAANPYLDRAVFSFHCKESSLAEQRAQQELQNPEHWQYLTDNAWVQGDDHADVVEHIRPLFADIPTERGFAIWMSNGPTRELPDMAFSLQTEAYVASYTVYEDPTEFQRNRDWLNGAFEHAQPVTAGQYLGDSDMTNRQLKFMGTEQFAKLQQIWADRDPDGRFVRYLAKDPATVNRNHWQL